MGRSEARHEGPGSSWGFSGLLRFLRGEHGVEERPMRLWIVRSQRPSGSIDPPYVTDPAHYGLRLDGSARAYLTRDDAQMCMAGSDVLSSCSVYDAKADGWVFNEVETNKLAYGLG